GPKLAHPGPKLAHQIQESRIKQESRTPNMKINGEMIMELHADEHLKYNIKANLKRGVEYVSGKLVITNKRLCFTPHFFTIQTIKVQLSMSEIKSVQMKWILVFFQIIYKNKCENRSHYTFVLFQTNEVINYTKPSIS